MLEVLTLSLNSHLLASPSLWVIRSSEPYDGKLVSQVGSLGSCRASLRRQTGLGSWRGWGRLPQRCWGLTSHHGIVRRCPATRS